MSLRFDPQGKTLSHALLAMQVSAPRALVDAAKRGDAAAGTVARAAAPTRAAARRAKTR